MTRRLTVLLSAGVFLLPCLPLAAANGTSPSPTFARPVNFAVSPPLREIAKLPAPTQSVLLLDFPKYRIMRQPVPGCFVGFSIHEQAVYHVICLHEYIRP